MNDKELAELMQREEITPEMDAMFKAMMVADPLTVRIPPVNAFFIVSGLQFLLRNASIIPDPVEGACRRLASGLQEALALGNPLAGQMLELGWHPEFDVKHEEPTPPPAEPPA